MLSPTEASRFFFQLLDVAIHAPAFTGDRNKVRGDWDSGLWARGSVRRLLRDHLDQIFTER